MKPHRATLILVFGILSIVVCQLFGPIAWGMGKTDLGEMERGNMDPEGAPNTKAGMICGIVGTVLLILGVIAIIAIGVLGVGVATLAPEITPEAIVPQ